LPPRKLDLLDTKAKRLNHAFTLLSQAFEVERMSHTGNVFQRGFTIQNGRWLSLDDLRLVRVMKTLEEIAREVSAERAVNVTLIFVSLVTS